MRVGHIMLQLTWRLRQIRRYTNEKKLKRYKHVYVVVRSKAGEIGSDSNIGAFDHVFTNLVVSSQTVSGYSINYAVQA